MVNSDFLLINIFLPFAKLKGARLHLYKNMKVFYCDPNVFRCWSASRTWTSPSRCPTRAAGWTGSPPTRCLNTSSPPHRPPGTSGQGETSRVVILAGQVDIGMVMVLAGKGDLKRGIRHLIVNSEKEPNWMQIQRKKSNWL